MESITWLQTVSGATLTVYYARRTPTPIFGQHIIHAGEVGVLLPVLAVDVVHTTSVYVSHNGF